MKSFVMAFAMGALLMLSTKAFAHGYVAYMPVGPAPVAAFYAPAPSYGPVVATSYYAPAPYYAAGPVPAPYYAAAPVVAPYYAAPVAVAPVYGRPVVVHPKVYIPGQPVRNVLRAVTP